MCVENLHSVARGKVNVPGEEAGVSGEIFEHSVCWTSSVGKLESAHV